MPLAFGATACSDDDSGGNSNNINVNDNENQNSQGVCGDGNVDSGEACDDGASNSDSIAGACRTDCREPWCGDSVTDPGEDCDDGNGVNTDGCLSACAGTDDCCVANVCGDGYQNQTIVGGDLVEMCDDGNTVDDAVCSADCAQDMTLCGDGSVDQGEECDYGGGNSDTVPDACRRNCHPAFCGDGVLDTGESCDGSDLGTDTCENLSGEGFTSGTLSCTAGCTRDTSLCTECGDGVIEWNEVCDGTNFAGETCATQGEQYGALSCNPDDDCLVLDTTGCYSYDATDFSDTSITTNLNDISGTGADHFMVVGDEALLREYDSGTWATLDASFTTEHLNGIDMVSGSGFAIVGDSGFARGYQNESWYVPSPPLPVESLNGVSFLGTDVYSVSSAGGVYRVPFPGAVPVDITPTSTPPALYDLWPGLDSNIYIVGALGTILEYDTSASTWQSHTSGVSQPLYGISGSASDNIYVVGGDGTGGVALHYDGTTWSPMTLPTGTPELRGVAGVVFMDAQNIPRELVFAVGVGGTIVHYDGAVWYDVPSVPTEDLNAVWGGENGIFYAVGDNGTVIQLTLQP